MNNCNNERKHNDGIDVMRICAMFMIVILHIINHGGIVDALDIRSVKSEILWILKIFAYGGVICFALISGYVGFGNDHKLRRISELVFRVLFYTLIVTGIFFAFLPGTVTLKIVLKALFPMPFNVYWYFSSYFFAIFVDAIY